MTKGRSTLDRALSSITSQFKCGDEILVLRSDLGDANKHSAALRNHSMVRAKGDYLLFMDDDDCYAEGALDTIRAAIEAEPGRIHIFKMRYSNGQELWSDPKIRSCNIGTPMFAVPRDGRLGTWPGHRTGDFGFISSTAKNHEEPAVFHEEVVALIRP